LRSDGVIFVTIDDGEVRNLRSLCDEVFGEENFVASVTWQKKVSPANDAKWFSSDHDYVLVYARQKETWRPIRLAMNERQRAYYQNPDDDARGPWNSATYTCNKTKAERPNLYYPIVNPNTHEEVWPSETAVWKYSRECHEQNVAEHRLYWGKDGTSTKPRFKTFLSEATAVVPRTVWPYSEVGHTQSATQEFAELMPEVKFETPKPVALIQRMLQLSTAATTNDIVMDFFAGSGATAHGVLELNRQDGGNRRFVLVQLPEPTGGQNFPTIADICKERVRRVVARMKKEDEGELDLGGKKKDDRGFRVFKLDESNFKSWDADVSHDPEALKKQLELHVDHVRKGRTPDDLLVEILLKSGFPLTTPVEKITLAGMTVHSVAEGALFVCLEDQLTLELIRAMADRKPERVVCLDQGFAGADQLKANAVQIFKTKGVTSFKTV
jgi:adenine-specific DNA-methyltransferase